MRAFVVYAWSVEVMLRVQTDHITVITPQIGYGNDPIHGKLLIGLGRILAPIDFCW
jgi:hypothetical protein